MSMQTAAPIERLSLNNTNRNASWFHHDPDLFDTDPPYQRGVVWTDEQRRALIKSLLMGLPIPPITLNHRINWYSREDPYTLGRHIYGVIDGKQRIGAIRAWFSGSLAVPASWFDSADITGDTTDFGDGPYITYSGLSVRERTGMDLTFAIPVIEATMNTLSQEAELYLLLNGSGVTQTDADMANAAHVAASGL